MTLQEFISEHAGDDTTRLLLGKTKWPEIDMEKAVTAIECRRKIRTKLPGWYANTGIEYPDKLCTEQCSSEETATYKAVLAKRIISSRLNDAPTERRIPRNEDSKGNSLLNGNLSGRIADLTGGLGVDSAAFAGIAEEVLYNEMESPRADAARHNFSILGLNNIRISNQKAVPEETQLWTELKAFAPDLIFIDPARRSASGSKVFLLEECSPDVLTLLPQIFDCSDNLLLKLSPMADITMAVDRLEKHGAIIREVHCIAADGECKELLVWASKKSKTPQDRNIVSDSSGLADNEYGSRAYPEADRMSCRKKWDLIVYENGKTLNLPNDTESNALPILADDIDAIANMRYLFEPGKALAKAGLFNTICRYGFTKAGIHTHIYFSPEKPDTEGIAGLGKIFGIEEILPLSKQNISKTSKAYPHCEVSAKNIPMTSDELRKKLRAKSGGDVHIFGVRLDFTSRQSAGAKKPASPSKDNGIYLIIARRIR